MTTKSFKSWQSFWNFERIVKKENRYFRSQEVEEFLQTLLETCENRKRIIPKGRYLWRAQHGHSWRPLEDEGEIVDQISAPYPPERMKPLLDSASEGRANPKGIPYLYLSNDREVAMSEVRPWLGSYISVGQFGTNKDLVLIDCSVHYDKNPIFFDEPDSEGKENAVWSHIDRAFSRPMTNNDKNADYVPTQILAELFKTNGYDGIIYKSLLGKGYNLALFDLNSATMVNCFLYTVEDIKINFSEDANPYYIKQ